MVKWEKNYLAMAAAAAGSDHAPDPQTASRARKGGIGAAGQTARVAARRLPGFRFPSDFV